MNNITIYGYSPRHVTLLTEIAKKLSGNAITLVGPKTFIAQVKKANICSDIISLNVIDLQQATKDITLMRRVINNLVNLRKITNLRTDVLITANEYALPSILLAADKKCKEIVVLDEGDFDIIFSKESKLLRYRIVVKLKALFLGLKPRLSDERISTIVSGAKIAKNLHPHKVIVPQVQLGQHRLHLGGKSILFLTSPLTENSNSLYNLQEIDILKRFAKENSDYKIYVRTHYREHENKYRELKEIKNVEILTAHSSVPIENINIVCEYTVGFHSTALLSENIKTDGRFSLSGLLNSQHALSILKQLEQKNLVLLNNFKVP